MSNMNNPFVDFMKSFSDMNNVAATPKRNMETMNAIGQIAMDAMRNIMSRSAEMVNNSSNEVMNHMKEVMASQNPESAAAKNQAFTKHIVENTWSNIEDTFEVVTKATKEGMKLVGKRVMENVNECCHNAPMMNAKKKAA